MLRFCCVCSQELELVEDVWRGEAQDLLSQIAQLQEENKTLLNNLSVKDYPMTEEDVQRQEGNLNELPRATLHLHLCFE